MLSWYYNQQPSPFLRWTEGDGVADTMGPTFRREDVRLHVRTPSVRRTETTLTISLPRTHPTRVSGKPKNIFCPQTYLTTRHVHLHGAQQGGRGGGGRGPRQHDRVPAAGGGPPAAGEGGEDQDQAADDATLQRHCPGSLVNISCSVAGVFPRPDITILVGSVPVRPDTQYLGRCVDTTRGK